MKAVGGGRHSETGIATVSAVVAVGLVMVIAASLVQVGLVLAAKHQAQAAADLAAVAGSAATLRGEAGCEVAAATARRNAVVLDRCRTDLAVVTVRTTRATEMIWGRWYRARAEARAAPDFYVDARGAASRSSRSSKRTAPALSSGSLPLPHFGD